MKDSVSTHLVVNSLVSNNPSLKFLYELDKKPVNFKFISQFFVKSNFEISGENINTIDFNNDESTLETLLILDVTGDSTKKKSYRLGSIFIKKNIIYISTFSNTSSDNPISHNRLQFDGNPLNFESSVDNCRMDTSKKYIKYKYKDSALNLTGTTYKESNLIMQTAINNILEKYNQNSDPNQKKNLDIKIK